jgi:hypothetical protein
MVQRIMRAGESLEKEVGLVPPGESHESDSI